MNDEGDRVFWWVDGLGASAAGFDEVVEAFEQVGVGLDGGGDRVEQCGDEDDEREGGVGADGHLEVEGWDDGGLAGGGLWGGWGGVHLRLPGIG